MTLRIAFCGPNAELCEQLADYTYQLLNESVLDIVRAPNALRELIEVIKRDDINENLDWMNLWGAVFRRIILEGMRENQVVISGSCGVDQVVWQATWLAEQMNLLGTGPTLLDPTGKTNLFSQQQVMINRSGAILQTLLNQTEEEVVDYWDFIYAVIPASANISVTPNAILTQYQDFLLSVPAFQSIERLSDNEVSARDALEQDLEKWKSKLNVS